MLHGLAEKVKRSGFGGIEPVVHSFLQLSHSQHNKKGPSDILSCNKFNKSVIRERLRSVLCPIVPDIVELMAILA